MDLQDSLFYSFRPHKIFLSTVFISEPNNQATIGRYTKQLISLAITSTQDMTSIFIMHDSSILLLGGTRLYMQYAR